MIKKLILICLIVLLWVSELQAKVHEFIHSSNTRASFAITGKGDNTRIYKKMTGKTDLIGRKTIVHPDGIFRLMCSFVSCSVFVIQSAFAELDSEKSFVKFELNGDQAFSITKYFKLDAEELWEYTSADETLTITISEKLFIFQYNKYR